MQLETSLECEMLERLLSLGHPSAFAKGMMLAATALHGKDSEAARRILDLLLAHDIPQDQRPAMAELSSDMGAILLAQGSAWKARKWFEHAVGMAPLLARAKSNLGACLIQLGEFAMARTLLESLPADAASQSLLGNLAHADGRLQNAVEHFETALRLAPDNTSLRADLAEALKDLGYFDKALDELRQAPESVETLCTQGNILKAMGDDAETDRAYGKAFDLSHAPAIGVKRALLLPVIPADFHAIDESRARLQTALENMIANQMRIEDPERQVGATLFHLAYHGRNDRALMELAARFWRQATPSLSFTAAHIDRWRPGKRLRIGFVSRHLHAHTMAKLNRGIIADLDRERFEVFVFQIGKMDETAREIAATADHAIHLAGPLKTIRQSIADARLDILYYPDIGMEPTTYFLAFARLAPVQLVACGHPDTTGIDTLDGFISGDPLDLPEAQAHYTEPLIRLSGFPFYMRRPPIGSVSHDRKRLGLPDDKRLYVCPQSLFKFHPEFDSMLAEILRRDPLGKLVLIEQLHPLITKRLKARLQALIPDLDERLIMLQRLSPQDFMTLLVSTDAVLDPWRFGGGSSSLEAFAQGVPVVTRPGDYLRERVTMAAYRKMGMTDMVADNATSYADIALRLANDPVWRHDQSLRLKDAAPVLFLDKAELKRMEEAMIKIAEIKFSSRT